MTINKKCKCGVIIDRVGQRYCKSCHNKWMRENRPIHSKLPEHERKKATARAYANVYQSRGLLIKKSCEICGCNNSQKHHDNYDKPLDVRWLCKEHHLKHHVTQRAKA